MKSLAGEVPIQNEAVGADEQPIGNDPDKLFTFRRHVWVEPDRDGKIAKHRT